MEKHLFVCLFFYHNNGLKYQYNYLNKYEFLHFLLYPMRSMGESIGIGLAASSPSKGPQAKTTEQMDSIKVTYCSIQLG